MGRSLREGRASEGLVLDNDGLVVHRGWRRWPQRQCLALAQGDGLVGPAGGTLGLR